MMRVLGEEMIWGKWKLVGGSHKITKDSRERYYATIQKHHSKAIAISKEHLEQTFRTHRNQRQDMRQITNNV